MTFQPNQQPKLLQGSDRLSVPKWITTGAYGESGIWLAQNGG
jgi:hypothetical protein